MMGFLDRFKKKKRKYAKTKKISYNRRHKVPPSEIKEIIRLREKGHHSYAEIGKRMGLSKGAIRARLVQAKWLPPSPSEGARTGRTLAPKEQIWAIKLRKKGYSYQQIRDETKFSSESLATLFHKTGLVGERHVRKRTNREGNYKKAVKLRRQGHSFTDIYKMTGVSNGKQQKMYEEYGLTHVYSTKNRRGPRPKNLSKVYQKTSQTAPSMVIQTNVQQKEIKRLYAIGLSKKQIALSLNIPQSRVAKYVPKTRSGEKKSQKNKAKYAAQRLDIIRKKHKVHPGRYHTDECPACNPNSPLTFDEYKAKLQERLLTDLRIKRFGGKEKTVETFIMEPQSKENKVLQGMDGLTELVKPKESVDVGSADIRKCVFQFCDEPVIFDSSPPTCKIHKKLIRIQPDFRATERAEETRWPST